MSAESPFSKPGPREEYAKAERMVLVGGVSLEKEQEHRDRRTAEFVHDVKEAPLKILQIIDLLTGNLEVFLAKRRLSSATSRKEDLNVSAHTEALELDQKYESLKSEAVRSEADFKNALQALADFEAENLQ